jgi:protein-tyrosine-phosphatase/tRNA A37 threonylcarbamoyladenosine synthetase subunit TsaC/SUA5/YrdC
MPTETVLAIAADVSITRGLDSLRRLLTQSGAGVGGLTWHAPTRGRAMEVFAPRASLHRRAFERLLPGPFRLQIECDEHEGARVRALLHVEPGVLDDKDVFALRVPDHPFTAEVLGLCAGTIAAVRADAVGLGNGRTLGEQERARAGALGVVLAIPGGREGTGYGSTTVRLLRDGQVAFLGGGIHDERQVRRRLERSILFVCTGNTCRSPMAAAIARHLLEKHPPSVPTRVESAGVAAGEGMPMTPEAAEVLREMGIDPGSHRSRPLTREMVREADVIYAMTRSHLDAIRALAPQGAARASLLNADGSDIPDPLGGPREVYRETARRLRDVLRQRLGALDSSGDLA